MHTDRFMGFACNIGDSMTFQVLQCNEDPHKRKVVFHRGVIVLHYLTATGYNSALAPNSDAYLPVVQVEDRHLEKPSHLSTRGPWIPPIFP